MTLPTQRRAADPSDLTPKLFPFEPDAGWFQSYWYEERRAPQAGLVRRAFAAIGVGAVAALRAAATHWHSTGAHAAHGSGRSLTA